MKINPINITTFSSKQQVVKKEATGITATTGASLAADTFIKGLSKPDKDKEGQLFNGNDKKNEDPTNSCCEIEYKSSEDELENHNCICEC